MHGDYDGSFSAGRGGLLFELHVDVNLCRTVNVTEVSRVYTVEVVAVAVAGNISVCLVDTGAGTPFVSAVELRPVPDTVMHSWFNQTQNLVLFLRVDLGTATNEVIRYCFLIFFLKLSIFIIIEIDKRFEFRLRQ